MKFRKNPNTDAFSNLPSNVVDKILSRLPLNEAVKTSVLSKDWRCKWMYIPELVIDYPLRRIICVKSKVETMVYHVLSRHMGQISKFCINVDCYSSSPHIDNWIHLLRNHKVEDFTINLLWGSKHVMPSCFFGFQHVRHLNLYRCVFGPLSEFTGLDKLVTLDFQDVEFVPAIFLKFISKRHLLEKIRLVDCTKWDSVEIEAPKLSIFIFHGAFRSIRFRNCPVLAEVSLSITMPLDKNAMISQRFEFLSSLERLHLHPNLLEFLDAAGSFNGLPQGLHRLKFLNLSLFLDTIHEVEFAIGLARASENLQMLRVTVYSRGTDNGVLEFLRAQQSSPDLHLNKLRRVEFDVFSFSKPQMAFARLLVASAPVLEEMIIKAAYQLPDPFAKSKLAELKQSVRASPDARIVLVQ